jgi:hypothetical protein
MGVLGIAAVNPPILFSLRLRIRGRGNHAYRNAKKPFNAEPYLQYRPLLEQKFQAQSDVLQIVARTGHLSQV